MERTWVLTKFDVAERQLLQAIQLFFTEGDAVSVHALAEASGQILYDMRHQFGHAGFLREPDFVVPDSMREWHRILFASRNFFKHGDRDWDKTHEFCESFNHFSLLDASSMHVNAKKEWCPETLVFFVWFTHRYPKLVREQAPIKRVIAELESKYPGRLDDLGFLRRVIDGFRKGQLSMSGVTLAYGVPSA